MSHFSQIKTQIRNLDTLKSVLSDNGIDWKSGPVDVRGYRGQTFAADLAIEQDNGYDIGFRWNESQYELVADLQYWKQPLSVEGFLNRITQGYACKTVVAATAEQGFQVAKQQRNDDGSVRLVLQRWGA
ncbi:MAG: DUF1257 domain-containing protein [Elainellaceae cyanobacterium]